MRAIAAVPLTDLRFSIDATFSCSLLRDWAKFSSAPFFVCGMWHNRPCATMAELADAADLGSAGETRGGSSPSGRTSHCIPCFYFSLARLRTKASPSLHAKVLILDFEGPSLFPDLAVRAIIEVSV